MATFEIETGDVSSVASSMTSIASELSSLASTVSGYDTACDEFNFSGPKATIAANIQACATKVTNTGSLMNEVVSAHTALQNSLSFDGSTSTTTETGTTTGTTTTGTTTTGTTTGTSPTYSGSTTSGTTSSGVSTGAAVTTVATTTAVPTGTTVHYSEQPQQQTQPEQPQQPSQPEPQQPEQPSQPEPQQPSQPEPQQPSQPEHPYTEIATGIGEAAATGLATEGYQGPQNGFSQIGGLGNVGYTGDEVKPLEVIKDPYLKYNDSGFAVIEDAYVISCPSEYGKVGDELIFTLKDGSTIKCVIGEIKTDPNDQQFTFFTNSSFNIDSPDNFTKSLVENLTQVKNTGQSGVIVRSKITKAIAYAYTTSQSADGMVIPENKLSYIISSYDKAGIKIDTSLYKKDGNIKDMMTKSGFIYQDGAPNPEELLPGDVLVTKDGNVLMYVEEDKVIVDYTTYEHTIDDRGNEVPIIKDEKYTVSGVYRFAPNDVQEQLLAQQNGVQGQHPIQGQQTQQGQQPIQGQQQGQLGPNGEQPGQLGPNGEQPPSAPPLTGGDGSSEELPRDSYNWDESAYY